MKLSARLDKIPLYLFVEISRKIAEKKARGEEVVSFGIGDPDFPTPSHIIERLCQAAHDPANHRYPETEGLNDMRQAITTWYQRRFGLTFDPAKEALPLIGAKEGIAHMALCFIDPGDIALVPDPGYPPYSMGTTIAGGTPYYLPLKEENGFLPDLEAIPADILKRAKLLWLNYPNNPTGAVAELDFFKKAVALAQKYGFAICHDACYTEIAYDGYRPVSMMQVDGAKHIGVEFHSLSKSYNMTGWRIGMMVGNAAIVGALSKMKSNLDSGVPQAIQYAAIEALTGSQDWVKEQISRYQRRRDLVVERLKAMGLRVNVPKGGLYVWARVPEGYTSRGFATELLEKVGVVVTPGVGYGQSGEGYIRLSLTTPDAAVEKGLVRLSEWRANQTDRR